MLASQVSREESERIKKRVYIGQQDEYNCSSQPLNGLVFSSILDSMPSFAASRKALKHGYIADLVREGGISPCSLLLGLMYIRRLALTNEQYLAAVSSRDLFLVAMVVASKYMNDEGELEALTNSEWSAIGCTPKTTVDQLERDFLKAMDWRLYVPIQEFYAFVGSVEGRVAMEQACRRGWMTYTDLSAVWENSDLQVSMMKHTAKVAFSGVTLYLVCVSTFLAALQPLSLFNADTASPALPNSMPALANSIPALANSIPALPSSMPAPSPAPAQVDVASSSIDALPPPWPGGEGAWHGNEAWPRNGFPQILITTFAEPANSSMVHALLRSEYSTWQDIHLQDTRLQDTGLQNTTPLQDTRLQNTTPLQDTRLQDTRLQDTGLQNTTPLQDTRLQDTTPLQDTRLQDTNTGLQDMNSGLQDTNTGLQDTNSGLQDTNSGLQDTNSGLQDTNTELQDTNTGLQDTHVQDTRLQDTVFTLANTSREIPSLPRTSTQATPPSSCLHQCPKSDHVAMEMDYVAMEMQLATVKMPQAHELSYHQKGTFHWDPFINSTADVSAALTFIVQYLTPHWVA